MSRLPRVKTVECLEGYRVRVAYTDGFTGSVDLEPILHGYYFEPLRSPERFREVAVSHGTLVWPNEADVCPDVLRYWCESGRVTSQEETDAHFAPAPSSSGTLMLKDEPKK